MNSQAAIEHHHDTQMSRAEVAATDFVLGLPQTSREIDRAVELLVDREPVRSIHPRPRSKAA